MYHSGLSPADIAEKYNCGRTTIKNIISAKSQLRSMSESSKLAVKMGKKDKSIKKLIESAKTYNRFNPKKRPPTGRNNPNWIKDRSLLKHKRSRTELKNWRKKVFERDNYTCQICDQKGGKLQADHILPYSHFEELRENVSNGRTLCERCHKRTNTYGNKLKNVLREEFLIF